SPTKAHPSARTRNHHSAGSAIPRCLRRTRGSTRFSGAPTGRNDSRRDDSANHKGIAGVGLHLYPHALHLGEVLQSLHTVFSSVPAPLEAAEGRGKGNVAV